MTAERLQHSFNSGLLELRETFHRTGRLDDSNAKLDELVKVLAIEIALTSGAMGQKNGLSELLAKARAGRVKSVVRELNKLLSQAAASPLFANNGEPLLGRNPRFNISEEDNSIGVQILQLVVGTLEEWLRQTDAHRNFEILNEAFGHFVRDNFRNNIEDAQYMTPPEVVSFMCDVAIEEVRKELSNRTSLTVMDPSCGVGSFLAQFYRRFHQSDGKRSVRLRLIGQDKVDRMARLAKINLLLFRSKVGHVYRGNSLFGSSPIDQFTGACDLILTNPPFGARFPAASLREMESDQGNLFRVKETSGPEVRRYNILRDIIERSNAAIDSEILFLDRYHTLLRPGGFVLAVVPDAIVSSAGLPHLVRHRVRDQFELRSVCELPSVTFAQAGTRTKTCVLHLQKKPCPNRKMVFFAVATDVGFSVSSRKGVPVKRKAGTNQLPAIFDAFKKFRTVKSGAVPVVLSEEPSAVAVPWEILGSNGWTPNHHSAGRYKTLGVLTGLPRGGSFTARPLSELVLPKLDLGKVRAETGESRCISVLHVGDFGFLNVQELMNYTPKYRGQPCGVGDVLFSKINPRIPRVLVVPDFGIRFTCSTEFEVLHPRPGFSPFKLALLLLCEFAQKQIQSLTSGTSSSHNRIKTAQLRDVLLPIPKAGSAAERELDKLSKSFRCAQDDLHRAAYQSHGVLSACNELLFRAV